MSIRKVTICLAVILFISATVLAFTSNKRAEKKAEKEYTPTVQTVTMTAVGDCTLATDINADPNGSFKSVAESLNGDYSYFFKNVSPIFSEDDLTIVNDTYIAAWNKIPPERPMRFLSWLYKVCRNIVCDRIDWNNASKRNSNMNCMLDELEECLADSNAKYEGELSDIGRCLSDFLNGLETEKRVLFVRRYWYGMTIDELADMSGRSKSSVKTTLFRIRAELKKYLDKEGVYL